MREALERAGQENAARVLLTLEGARGYRLALMHETAAVFAHDRRRSTP
jgi:hypothetical protein